MTNTQLFKIAFTVQGINETECVEALNEYEARAIVHGMYREVGRIFIASVTAIYGF